jgi:hypothetical protein
MFVTALRSDGSCLEAYPVEPDLWDQEFRAGLYVDEAANSNVIVNTPDGPMSLCDALMLRTGAFSLIGGQLHHDSEWREAV